MISSANEIVAKIKTQGRVPSKEIIVLGFTLGILQVLDALMTGVGVAHFGSGIEANLLLRYLIDHLGYIPALAIVKTFAIIVVVALCSLATIVPWVTKALKAVIAIYLVAAIIPWTAVILLKVI